MPTVTEALAAWQKRDGLDDASAAMLLDVSTSTLRRWKLGGFVKSLADREKIGAAVGPDNRPIDWPARGGQAPREVNAPLSDRDPPPAPRPFVVKRRVVEEGAITLDHKTLMALLGIPEGSIVYVFLSDGDIDEPKDAIGLPLTVTFRTVTQSDE